jgi:outer membrane biosynthesis protein TonB
MTAGSRSIETPAAKRFFDSLIFKPDNKELPNPGILAFSRIKNSAINIENADEKDFPVPPKNISENSANDEENKGKLLVLHRPRPAYVDPARMSQVQGVIKFRVTFSADGFFSNIKIMKSLPEGLTRQALFALFRMKFIPKHENSKPVDSTKTVEYKFTIY